MRAACLLRAQRASTPLLTAPPAARAGGGGGTTHGSDSRAGACVVLSRSDAGRALPSPRLTRCVCTLDLWRQASASCTLRALTARHASSAPSRLPRSSNAHGRACGPLRCPAVASHQRAAQDELPPSHDRARLAASDVRAQGHLAAQWPRARRRVPHSCGVALLRALPRSGSVRARTPRRRGGGGAARHRGAAHAGPRRRRQRLRAMPVLPVSRTRKSAARLLRSPACPLMRLLASLCGFRLLTSAFRAAPQSAELTFLPYNYLIDPALRRALGANFEWHAMQAAACQPRCGELELTAAPRSRRKRTVLLFDEAHNLVRQLELLLRARECGSTERAGLARAPVSLPPPTGKHLRRRGVVRPAGVAPRVVHQRGAPRSQLSQGRTPRAC